MKRTTITLPEDLAEVVDREAARRRVSVSEVVRSALAAQLVGSPGTPRPLPFAGLGRSGFPDLARRVDEILDEDWVRDTRRDS